jgi:hypothetical protein
MSVFRSILRVISCSYPGVVTFTGESAYADEPAQKRPSRQHNLLRKNCSNLLVPSLYVRIL